MLSRTEATLLKESVNKDRGVLDATAGRILRAQASYGGKNEHVVEYTNAIAAKIAEASSIAQKLVESLDSFLRQ